MEENRVETLLNAIINGETIDFNPQSRMEEYLKNCINKTGVEGLPTPQSRMDALLYRLAETITSGGSSNPTVPTPLDGRTSLTGWYQYLNNDIRQTMDWDTYEYSWVYRDTDEPVTELKLVYPSGTQYITDAQKLMLLWTTDPENDYETFSALPVTEVSGILDLPNVENINLMFSGCSSLRDVGDIRFGINLNKVHNAFWMCTKIKSLPTIDMRDVTNASNVVSQCISLEHIDFKNIKVDLFVSHCPLTVDSLVNLIYELRDTGSSKTLTVGSTNLAKLSNVYVKTINITKEMRVEDSFIDEKLPFVVCSSTDAGAIRITDYVLAKNWILK